MAALLLVLMARAPSMLTGEFATVEPPPQAARTAPARAVKTLRSFRDCIESVIWVLFRNADASKYALSDQKVTPWKNKFLEESQIPFRIIPKCNTTLFVF
ncbi:exported hypothetical protein [Massilia sp. 9I]|nr:exported hypothetical protein [Massilia sp. 9I]